MYVKNICTLFIIYIYTFKVVIYCICITGANRHKGTDMFDCTHKHAHTITAKTEHT